MTVSDTDALFEDLLSSAARLSFDARNPAVYEVGPEDKWSHGMTPEWSPLFGTSTWASMSEAERSRLTRSEVAQFLGVAIWLELGLQVALLRRHVDSDPALPEVKFLLNECADENLHSLMFVNAVGSMGGRFYARDRSLAVFGWMFRSLAWPEVAFGITLAGEEIFDVMQRDWMSSENVTEAIRRTSYIHVVEESRHMQYARTNIRDRMSGASRFRRSFSALLIAIGTHVIAKSLINRRVYEDLGLDWSSVKQEIDGNDHHKMMFRKSVEPYMEFLRKAGLLNGGARWIYRKSNLL